MMGMPEGWITAVPGVTRNIALKAAGNGVVPQQAYAALRHMLMTYRTHPAYQPV
jgi:DNA (cytosine-5)-methyltransferase 1